MLIRSLYRVRRSIPLSPSQQKSIHLRAKMSTSTEPLKNVLGESKSPYLLQHKDNPVAVSLLAQHNAKLRIVARIYAKDYSTSKRTR
jgi:hypothetical protein